MIYCFDEEILKQIVSEADDITNKISEYGILDEEEIQSMRKNAERKEEQIQRIESEQQPNQALLPIQPTSESIVDNDDDGGCLTQTSFLYLSQQIKVSSLDNSLKQL